MNQQVVARYEKVIYQSLVIDADPAATIERLRQQNTDELGTAEWQEAIRQATARFEARS